MEYVFNPTAGIPKTSYNEKSAPVAENITWFSTVQPELSNDGSRQEID